MKVFKKKFGLIILGAKPVYFDTWKQRQAVIDGIKGNKTYSTFTAIKEIKKTNKNKKIGVDIK